MSFSNGFEEDDEPILLPHRAQGDPSLNRHQHPTQTQQIQQSTSRLPSASRRLTELDLTGDDDDDDILIGSGIESYSKRGGAPEAVKPPGTMNGSTGSTLGGPLSHVTPSSNSATHAQPNLSSLAQQQQPSGGSSSSQPQPYSRGSSASAFTPTSISSLPVPPPYHAPQALPSPSSAASAGAGAAGGGFASFAGAGPSNITSSSSSSIPSTSILGDPRRMVGQPLPSPGSLAAQQASQGQIRNATPRNPLTQSSALQQQPGRSHSLPSGNGLVGVPLISNANQARLPSQFLPQRTASGNALGGAGAGGSGSGGSGSSTGSLGNYYKQQSAQASQATAQARQQATAIAQARAVAIEQARAQMAANQQAQAAAALKNGGGKGKEREVLDLTNAPDEVSPKPEGGEPLTLSSGSDNEIHVVEEHPICIGQLTSLALILYPITDLQPVIPTHDQQGNPFPPGHVPVLGPQPPLAVHIVRGKAQNGNETLKLVAPRKREVFGVMEHRVANVLAPLIGEGLCGIGVQGQLRGGGKVWCEASIIRRGERNPMMMPLLLLLFARPIDVPAISAALDKATTYLEHPMSYNPAMHANCRYNNPHNPAAGVSGRNTDAERRRQQMMGSMYQSSAFNGGAYGQRNAIKTVEVQRQQVDEVFKNLKSGVDLEEQEPSPLVVTKLYPHQKQALSFLMDREKIKLIPQSDKDRDEPTMISLWQRVSDTYGRVKGWKSLVTNLEIAGAKPPPQARGSILADDMGLGKTIVVISLVCTTLDEAVEWARKPLEKDNVDERFEEENLAPGMRRPGGDLTVADFSTQLYGIAPRTLAEQEAAASGSGGSDGGKKKLTKKELAKQAKEKRQAKAVQNRFSKLVTRSRATLIVCPLSTVQNWESQFEEHTGIGAAHPVPLNMTAEMETSHDLPEPDCKEDVKMEEDEVNGGRKYRFVPKRKLPKAASTKMKLSSSEATSSGDDSEFGLVNDAEEDDDDEDEKPKPKRAISVYVYHGNARCQDPRLLADNDVVITTFSTLGTEYSKQARMETEREEDIVQVCAFDAEGNLVEAPSTSVDGGAVAEGGVGKKAAPAKRKRKKAEGDGASPLQAIQWFRVVLDEAHIIKEHTTIQARAACDLSTQRRVALSGTPLQNSLNDLFSLISFLRLEPFTDRAVWTQHIGALAKNGDPLGVSRLQLIMRHLCLRRTKQSVDKDGKPILALPANNQKVVPLAFDQAEHAFYNSHHLRYKHDFKKLEETDSVMKNYCSILQELLRLRQICVHMALVKDSEDSGDGAGADLSATIREHGISKKRAVQLLALMRDAGGGQCSECACDLLPQGAHAEAAQEEVEDTKKPARKARKLLSHTTKSATASAANSDAEDSSASASASASGAGSVPGELVSVITKCQHLFCELCFKHKVCPTWPRDVKSDDRALCTVCRQEMIPALDAVAIGARELHKALDDVDHARSSTQGKSKTATRLVEHSTKTKALLRDVFPFSQANPASANFWPEMDSHPLPKTEEEGGTIGFQPMKGEVVKSVVFSQWTKLLDRLGDALDEQHIKYGRLDGGMNREQRSRAMDLFKSDPSTEILLVSLRAGGVGLNLTVARRVYLMEPFWNPAVENQAIDRIHRLGQTRDVQTVRFVIEKSIEENMLKIQKRKMDLANMSLTQTLSKAEVAKQRMEDLRTLLS